MLRVYKFLTVLLALTLLLSGCGNDDPRYLQPSGQRVGVPAHDLAFDEYLAQTRGKIQQAVSGAFFTGTEFPFGPDYPLERVVDMRSPYQFLPSPDCNPGQRTTGFLLIHGLSDSPYLLSAVAGALADLNPCALVRSVLLPGHGTVPGDALDMHRRDWQQKTQYAIDSFRHQVDDLFIVGYSAGATLAVQYADQHRDDGFVKGLVLLSPAMGLPRSTVWLSPYVRWFSRWLGIEQELDAAKYETFSINAGAEFYLLIRDMRWQRMRPLELPVIMVVSGDDATVDVSASQRFFCAKASPEQRHMIWYQSYNEVENGCSGIESVSAKVPQMRLVSSSHVGITLPADDAHYGLDGGYRQCLHYGENAERNQQCRDSDSTTVYGERHLMTEGLYEGQLLRRTTFNPFFTDMMATIQCFIEADCALNQ